ncbi:MAG: U32 family peptidase [Bacteroidales bacterium]|nr:U32 family peptidase [Bacteroidales bacterium]
MSLELLAPARDAEIGIEAFRHGADAVYIGAPRFSARAAAGNSLADIERMAAYGHQFGARTLVAFNTIMRDDELADAERLTWQLYEAGVDALIVQDLGLLSLNLPPIPLHASTQTDNRTLDKIRLMHRLGFTRVVLARELSVDEIRAIHEAEPDIELECFVHGALCVCYSGQCYLSAALTGRSANRGECAQPCRLPMDLLDADGRTIVAQKHLLSLRDMNRSEWLGDLIDAGVTSFKIEGRLKDKSYVKNVVAYYRQALDAHLSADEKSRSSRVTYTFTPAPEKSFNRGFTGYFANGRREEMWNFDSPKSMGEWVGSVDEIGSNFFKVKTEQKISNGDGLVCGRTVGFRANRVDEQGRIFPLGGAEVCRQLKKGMEVRRNLDHAFEQLLERPSADRRVPLSLRFSADADCLQLELRRPSLESILASAADIAKKPLREPWCSAEVTLQGHFERAQKSQADNIRRQLTRLGDSIYVADGIEVTGDEWFVPSSMLAQLRRDGVAALDEKWRADYEKSRSAFVRPDYAALAAQIDATGILPTDYKANVLNRNARQILAQMGLADVAPAFEQQQPRQAVVMQTKHCLRMALGFCPKYHPQNGGAAKPSAMSAPEPWKLRIGRSNFILKFGCKNSCVSEIIRIFAAEKNEP